ncbi:hypothetical protein NPX13_g6604 [Xylaria arbuscula]|uniref:Uncharacterized protein n=1 Tax=Xylaria arbuscula TaxID=114810 RepID=A0A9W8NC86_9PEZI|nr:hypothetical protein NPX13_g6604 [Xylaria arbuscula]
MGKANRRLLETPHGCLETSRPMGTWGRDDSAVNYLVCDGDTQTFALFVCESWPSAAAMTGSPMSCAARWQAFDSSLTIPIISSQYQVYMTSILGVIKWRYEKAQGCEQALTGARVTSPMENKADADEHGRARTRDTKFY